MPHQAIDPVPVACEIVTAIQVFVTRRIDIFDPVVVTIAKIDGGSTNNVIPEVANLLGTIRSLSEAAREAACSGISRLAERIAQAHECEAEVRIERGFPVTHCDARAVRGFEGQVPRGLRGGLSGKARHIPRVRCGARLSGNSLNRARQLAENELFELHLGAGIVDIDADQVPIGIVVQHDAFRNLATLNTRPLREIDVKRISFRVVVELHGLNRRSGKAL